MFETEFLEQRRLLSAAAVSLQTDSTGVASQLLDLVAEEGAEPSVGVLPIQPPATAQTPIPMLFDSAGRVGVQITAQDVSALTQPLSALGFVADGSFPADHLIDGYLPISSIDSMNSLTAQGLMGVLPMYKPLTSTGEVDSEGDSVLEADRTRAATGLDGTGVTVGVLSDSYNNLGTAAADVATGDLPPNVDVLEDESDGLGTDEGRAMLQIVHDLAPGANLAFATADGGDAAFAQNIEDLAAPVSQGGAGANIIADDITYTDEPFYQDGVIAQAIDNVVTNDNVSYFSAAGNDENQAYESTNVNFISDTIPGISANPGSYYNFNPTGTAADKQSFSLTSNQAIALTFQWDQPFYTTSGVTSDLNIYVLNDSTGAVVASSTDDAIANQTPLQFVEYQNTTGVAATYDVVISLAAGPAPDRIKYVNYGANDFGTVAFQYATNSPTINPHAAAADAMAVAAAPFYDQRTAEPFDSDGPATILFDPSGNPLATPQIRAKPDITAIDGVSTTFFGGDDLNGFPNFFGTSAATPHAAAVAALIKEAHPSWTPAQIYADLKASADPNIATIDGGPIASSDTIGAGLIDAYRAIVGSPIAATGAVDDGFETGFLGQDWQTYTAGSGRVSVTSANSPSSGNYQLIEDSDLQYFDPSFYYTLPTLSEATLNVNLAGQSNVTLSFDEKPFTNGVDINEPMPATFTGHGNYDGVAFSVDGVHWYLAQALQGLNATSAYQTFSVNLSALATADGLVLTADTQIKFQHYDPGSASAPNAGFAFDNIKVGANASLTGSTFYFRLDADMQQVDIWNNSTGTGAMSQSMLISQILSLIVTGSGTGDNFIVNFQDGDPLPIGGISFTGAAGVNTLTIIGDGGNDNVTVNASTVTVVAAFGSTPITYSKLSSITFVGGTGDNTLTQAASPGGGANLVFSGMTSADTLNVNGGTFTFPAGSGSGLTTDLLGTLSITNGARVIVAAPTLSTIRTLLVVDSLSIAGVAGNWQGLLDLNNNDMIIRSGNLANTTAQLQAGLNLARGGYWNGSSGIRSTTAAGLQNTALGMELNNNGSGGVLLSTFDGQTVGSQDILIKYTYFGDSNLDGTVNAADYLQIDNGVNSGGNTWNTGDFNYDGVVNGDDYALMDNAYNTQSTASPLAAPANQIATGAKALAVNFSNEVIAMPPGDDWNVSNPAPSADDLLDDAADNLA